MTCAKRITRATIIAPDGQRFIGTNDVRNPQPSCPREGMPPSVGYELCKSICNQSAHAEVNACLAAGESAHGGTLYLEGHYYVCENCKLVAAEHGVEIVMGAPPAIAAAARQSGDVKQAPSAGPQSGHEVASPKGHRR